ncbi:alternative ribosome rescue aminoacyl-tRNA hydrolase ArfB [Flavobacterium sp. J27]|uniref:alternative ribosome rescue aminoacyl-tRNA hydrolase ArfB n=1 Tax=Flavobacterium sp. J27 TaxID=2060419 RepID=UPI00103111EC|nr:alternative ribosome rescue aminoacyl-tRNA hydrolase ArfB [Flavobacterium sp. J27]
MNKEIIASELNYKAVRSSGAGGQNVNKVASKVILTYNLENSLGLEENEKVLLKEKLATKITQENNLILACDEDRSQLKNKEIVTKRFFKIIVEGLKVNKPRKVTKVPKAVKEKRRLAKKTTSQIKESRKKPKP